MVAPDASSRRESAGAARFALIAAELVGVLLGMIVSWLVGFDPQLYHLQMNIYTRTGAGETSLLTTPA